MRNTREARGGSDGARATTGMTRAGGKLLATILGCYLLGAGVLSTIARVQIGYWAAAAALTLVGGLAITNLSRGWGLTRLARVSAVVCFASMWLVTLVSPWFQSLAVTHPFVVIVAVFWSAGAWALYAELLRLTPTTTVGA